MFSRRNAATVDKPVTTTRPIGVGNRQKFRLGRWLRLHGLDIILLALAGAAALGIYYAPPAYSRYFPIQFQNGQVVYPSNAVPMQKNLVPIWLAALLAFIVPFLFFCIYQIRLRSMDHLFTTTLGLLKSLVTAALFQVIIKCLIGGTRPHFLVVCNPRVPAGSVGSGFQQLYFRRDICQGSKKHVNDALESMPSGHATAAFAGLIFLALYFNAQLKLLSAHNPAYWKMLLFMTPILGAILIAMAMNMNGYHHWRDIIVGALIGTGMAFVAFRMTFASVWDFRFNHVLLPRISSLFLRRHKGDGADAVAPAFDYVPGGSGQWPVTREGGWNEALELSGGAPFDANATGVMGGAGMGAGRMGGNTGHYTTTAGMGADRMGGNTGHHTTAGMGADRMGGHTGNYAANDFDGHPTHVTDRTSGDASTRV